MTLREKLIVLRNQAGMSQMALAEQVDVSRQAVTRWESGASAPTLDNLKALAKIYNVSLDWLCNDDMDLSTESANAETAEQSTLNEQIPHEAKKVLTPLKLRIAVFCVILFLLLLGFFLAARGGGSQKESQSISDLTSDDISNSAESNFDFEW